MQPRKEQEDEQSRKEQEDMQSRQGQEDRQSRQKQEDEQSRLNQEARPSRQNHEDRHSRLKREGRRRYRHSQGKRQSRRNQDLDSHCQNVIAVVEIPSDLDLHSPTREGSQTTTPSYCRSTPVTTPSSNHQSVPSTSSHLQCPTQV
jgi:hypothetical protein